MVGRMVGFVLTELGGLLKQLELYHAFRAVQYGLSQSSHHFYGVLERYNPLTGTFFTPIGEMGFTFHELYEVSGLVIGDAPYEEYVPTTEELHLLKKEDPQVYETYFTSISVGKRPSGGIGALSRCPGRATFSMK